MEAMMLPRRRTLDDIEAEAAQVYAEIAFEQDRTLSMAAEHFMEHLHADNTAAAAAGLRLLIETAVRNEITRRRVEGLE
jgi:hypothetical protein